MKLWKSVVGFLAWWKGELAASMPGFLRRSLSAPSELLELWLESDGARVAHRGSGRAVELGRLSVSGEGNEGVLEALRRLVPDGLPVVLHVPAAICLSRELELPTATQENLHEVLGFEMDRRTPFSAKSVVYGERPLGRVEGRVRVELRLVPRTRLQGVLAALDMGSLQVASVALDQAGGLVVRYLPEGAGLQRASHTWKWPMIINLALLAVVVAWPLRQQHTALRELREEVRLLRQKAEQAQALRGRLDQRLEQEQFLLKHKQIQTPQVAILDELTRRLPDETWLHRLEVRNGVVQIQGVSDAASSLIASLEDSPLFENARFRSPVTQDPSGNRERFQLSVDLVDEGWRG